MIGQVKESLVPHGKEVGREVDILCNEEGSLVNMAMRQDSGRRGHEWY